jgi:hypothetical protein
VELLRSPRGKPRGDGRSRVPIRTCSSPGRGQLAPSAPGFLGKRARRSIALATPSMKDAQSLGSTRTPLHSSSKSPGPPQLTVTMCRPRSMASTNPTHSSRHDHPHLDAEPAEQLEKRSKYGSTGAADISVSPRVSYPTPLREDQELFLGSPFRAGGPEPGCGKAWRHDSPEVALRIRRIFETPQGSRSIISRGPRGLCARRPRISATVRAPLYVGEAREDHPCPGSCERRDPS